MQNKKIKQKKKKEGLDEMYQGVSKQTVRYRKFLPVIFTGC